MRVLLAHEMGKAAPCAYTDISYINPKWYNSNKKWENWCDKLETQISRSKEDCIEWYRREYKELPIWVSIQAWDFGMLSKYFSMLKGKYQNAVCWEIHPSLTPSILKNWLEALNILRNRCAHHSRIWNQTNRPLPGMTKFLNIPIAQDNPDRLAGLITILCFFVRRLGEHSTWLDRVENAMKKLPELPACTFESMGFSHPLRESFIMLRNCTLKD